MVARLDSRLEHLLYSASPVRLRNVDVGLLSLRYDYAVGSVRKTGSVGKPFTALFRLEVVPDILQCTFRLLSA